MIVTYLDTKTGETAQGSGVGWYALVDGNWSCDCNRFYAFELADDEREHTGHCRGSERFLVTKVEHEESDSDDDKRMSLDLEKYNRSYPIELRQKHGLP